MARHHPELKDVPNGTLTMLEDAEVRSGVEAPIVNAMDYQSFRRLLQQGEDFARTSSRPHYLIYSLGRFYITDHCPKDNMDIDAIYVVEFPAEDAVKQTWELH